MKKENVIKLKTEIYDKVKGGIPEIMGHLSGYDISHGIYSEKELLKALYDEKPCFIEQGKGVVMLVGAVSDRMIASDLSNIRLEKMTKAIIIEDIKEISDDRDDFMILGENSWDDIDEFLNVFGKLKVGEIFLPPHSAVFNFREQTEEEINNKIVSVLEGVNISMMQRENYIDNVIHEMGHLFCRDCLTYEERKAFGEYHKRMQMSALYNFEWEKSDWEEMFCTFYKYYIKSILVHKSFYNILEHEDPQGLALLQAVFDRITSDKMTTDTWDVMEKDIIEYFNPKYDMNSGRFIRKKSAIDYNGLSVPRDIADNVDRVENGIEYFTLNKAAVGMRDNKIVIDIPMRKADYKPRIFVDMDGVVADFVKGYQEMTGRDAHLDDPDTIRRNCMDIPNYFRMLPVLQKGKNLFDELEKIARIVFLTTPTDGIASCKRDKIEWIREHFGDYDVIFSSQKDDYAHDDHDILIDDMSHNLEPWAEAGGTAINILDKNDAIIKKVKSIFGLDIDEGQVRKDIAVAVKATETNPTEAQKEAGNYAKGKFNYKGLDISIENPKGSMRFGIGFGGKKWMNHMNNHYGYIKKTNGADDDHIDVFIGDDLKSQKVFVVNQNNPKTGEYDEVKVMLGFLNPYEAKQAYLANYDKSWKGLGDIVPCTMTEFKKWLQSGDMRQPYMRKMIKAKKILKHKGKIPDGKGGFKYIYSDTTIN